MPRKVGASIPLHTDYLHALVFQHLGHAWNWVDTQISQSPQCIGCLLGVFDAPNFKGRVNWAFHYGSTEHHNQHFTLLHVVHAPARAEELAHLKHPFANWGQRHPATHAGPLPACEQGGDGSSHLSVPKATARIPLAVQLTG